MLGIEAAVPTTNQPIGGGASATLFGETKKLTDWITPDSIEIQELYQKLTKELTSPEDKILACVRYVADRPYKAFIKARVNLDGVTFIQNDVWLMPNQAIRAKFTNCANRSFLLTSLLRQEFDAYSVIGNLNVDHQDGHAWNYVALNGGYMLEPTAVRAQHRMYLIEAAPRYEDVVYFNEIEVREVPDRQVREPLSACYDCNPFLSDYLAGEYCR